jgi:hypothetical protein
MSDEEEEEHLLYGILGEDAASDLDKLEKYTGEVSWKYLEKHYHSGALLYVDPSLDLIAVGKAFADDDADSVAKWRKSGDIIQPSTPHAFYWEESDAGFTALVVSPFVLIQPVDKT